MAECILMQSGGGTNSDDLTATSDMVVAGYTYVGNDTDNDMGTGTGSKIYSLGTGTSFNVANKLPNCYQNLTNANFIIEPVNGTTSASGGWRSNTIWADGGGRDGHAWANGSSTIVKSYNATSGVLTAYQTLSCSGGQSWDQGDSSISGSWSTSGGSNIQVNAYVYIGNMA